MPKPFKPESVKVILPLTKIDPTKPLKSQTVKFLDLGNLIRNRVVSIETGAPGASETVRLGRQATYAPDAAIRLLKQTNPRRKGTGAWKQFEIYRKARTVADFVRRGGDRGYLNNDVRRGLIRITQRARGPGRKAA